MRRPAAKGTVLARTRAWSSWVAVGVPDGRNTPPGPVAPGGTSFPGNTSELVMPSIYSPPIKDPCGAQQPDNLQYTQDSLTQRTALLD